VPSGKCPALRAISRTRQSEKPTFGAKDNDRESLLFSCVCDGGAYETMQMLKWRRRAVSVSERTLFEHTDIKRVFRPYLMLFVSVFCCVSFAASRPSSPVLFDVPAPCSQAWAIKQGSQADAIRFGRDCLRKSANHSKMTKAEVYQQALKAIQLGHPLLTLRPTDAADFCLRYLTLNESERRVYGPGAQSCLRGRDTHEACSTK
jgi:hypothetical protein